ncbi:DUF2971 domain-containing protein [Photobacterium damselae]|uniref:DUF2971 domain-containing protein n=1 Tax=Photobacterium damselae TaxID=38293 RepID=UPI0011B2866B|nr:DUF2971 domain-containing protein [Photobacterium damselae]
MYLYKYQSVSPLSLMMLKRGEIYFASASELNDRHECRARYLFNAPTEVWIRFIDYVLLEVCYKYKHQLYQSPKDAYKLIELAESIFETGYGRIKKRILTIYDTVQLFNYGFDAVLGDEFTLEEKKKIKQYTERYLLGLSENKLRENKYICSFSKNAINPTMWGHYGAAETGFVVIYESSDGYMDVKSTLPNLFGYREKEEGWHEIGKYTNESLMLRDVKYSKQPCKVNAFDRLIPKFRYSEKETHYDEPEILRGQIDQMEVDKVGLVKFTDWKYEQEVRLLFPTYEKLPSEHRCLQVNSRHIKGVIFGSKTSDSSKERVLMACTHLLGHIKDKASLAVFQVLDSYDNYSYQVFPVGMVSKFISSKRPPLTEYDCLNPEQKEYLSRLGKSIAEQS